MGAALTHGTSHSVATGGLDAPGVVQQPVPDGGNVSAGAVGNNNGVGAGGCKPADRLGGATPPERPSSGLGHYSAKQAEAAQWSLSLCLFRS